MSDCQNCQDSILSKTKSLITNPSCSEECPDIVCEVLTYPTCIPLTKDYSCLGVGVTGDDTLSDLLDAVELKCASGQASANIVKASSDDSCPGTLITKLDSETLNVTLSSPSGCQQVLIEEKDWTWVELTPKQNWIVDGVNPAFGYRNTNIPGKGEVRFRGQLKWDAPAHPSFNTNATDPQLQIFNILPGTAWKPIENKRFFFFAVNNSNNPFLVEINVSSGIAGITAKITRVSSFSTANTLGIRISLDQISYIK